MRGKRLSSDDFKATSTDTYFTFTTERLLGYVKRLQSGNKLEKYKTS